MAAFDGGSITSNAGALLLRGIDRSLGLFDRGGRLLHGPARSASDGALGAQAGRAAHHRLALGYEDLNVLRHDRGCWPCCPASGEGARAA